MNEPMIQMPTTPNWRWHWIEILVKQHNWTVGAELGVKEGRCTNHLLQTCPNLFMHCVDLWDIQPNNDKKLGGETYETWDNEGYYQNFTQTMEYWYPNRYKIYRMYTTDATKLIDDETLDFVFIDADHSFEGVSTDIRNWAPKVKSTGAILGHDYSWLTVQKAIIQEFTDTSKVFKGFNNCWGILKKDI